VSEIEFLLHLRGLGVKLWLEGDAVKFSAPKGALTPELKDELKARKEEIRRFLVEAAQMSSDGARQPIPAIPRDRPLPLSFGQERLWFLEQLEPGGAAYAIPAALRLEGPLVTAALQRAVEEIVRRHESLRTTFSSLEGQPIAVIHERVAVPLPITDLSPLSPPEREIAMRREIALESRRSFDLASGPLLRARLLRLGPEEHVLVSAMHHIVSDGWSSNVFARELGVLYDAFAAGQPSPLPELPIQYGDFAAWQRDALGGDALDRQLAYWKKRLAGALASIDLPTDRPRPPVPSLAGSWRRFTLSPELSAALRELAQREGVTLFMLLLAAASVLLARSSGQDDLVVGSPIAGRTRPETEPLIGFFVNTLVLRAEVDPASPFRALLAQVKATCLGAYAHQDMPFERLVQAISPERDPSRSPLFQVLFSLQNAGGEGGSGSIASVRRRGMAVDSGTSKFDLTVAMADGPSGLYGVIEYATDLFDARTIDAMGSHLAVLLEGIVADPAQAIGALPILPAAERRVVVDDFNATRADYPRGRLVHELVEAQSAATPDAIALVFEGISLTYRELDRRANRLAHALRRRGVGPDVLVGVCLERSIELVVALHAVLRAGGAYVPLDPEYPTDRLAFMLDDTKVSILLTQAHLEAALPPHRAEVLLLDTGWGAIEIETDSRVDRGDLALTNLAYVIYTSGSTGRPKGAMNEHRGILNRLQWMQEAYGLTGDDRVLQKTPFSFDVSVWEFFWPLMFGATLVVARPDGHRDPAYLARTIGEQRITTLHFVPSMLKVFLDELEPDSSLSRVATLRRVFASGEALLPAMVDTFAARVPGAALHNLYGPTEAAVDVTAWECVAGSAIVPIGKPIKNARIYLLDARMIPVPIGQRGELYIGGVQVARGYLNRPELTAERFVPDPFVPADGYPLYRTGDVARWLPTGAIEYLGRTDFQVKIRGFRIELGEIEAALSGHPGVREVVVVAREDVPGDRKIVAYLAAAAGAAPTSAELRAALKERLPEYMVPASFVLLDALPLTASGKIDRKALPAPTGTPVEARVHVAPRGPVEAALATIFGDVLAATEIGAHDDFFDRGGHSLLATQVMARIRTAFAVDLPLRALFDAPSPAGLAARVEAALRAGHGVAAPPLVRVPRGGPLPASFAQERLWFLDQLEPGDPSYVVPTTMHLAGALDIAALRRALHDVVLRHESLRTTFAESAGQPVQIVHDELDVELPLTSVTSLPIGEREAAVRRELAAEVARPFDLATGPLVRARLFQLADDDHVLFVALHHIVSDAWTLGILNREISTLYRAHVAGAPLALPALPIQYADYAAWQRAWLSGDVLDAQLAYWRQRLHGAPAAIELPTDRPRPAVPSHRGAHRSFTVSGEITAGLEALARKQGATLFMTLLAAFDVLLHRTAGQDDVVVGTPIAGRTQAETEGLIGFFVNTLVLRAEIDPEQSFRDLLARVKETCLGAYAHQDTPFERLVQALAPERDLGRSPLFQVVFVLQNAAASALDLDGVRRRSVNVESTTAKFDLTLAMARTARGTLAASIEYATDLFDVATIDRMIGHLGVLLAGIVADPSRRIWELPILPDAERRILLDSWSGARTDYPRDAGIAAVFEAQVDASPDAVAVVFGDAELTYRELDRRANRLANALRKQGVGPEVRVGLFARRSLEMVIATLAILKAGGAYVPLDPEYPPQRLAFLRDDARLRVIVTAAAASDVAALGVDGIAIVDASSPDLAAESDARLPATTTGESLAYVMYTSGSTGLPKGVLVLHRGVVRLVKGTDYTAFGADEVFLQFAPIAFDAATFEIWGPLLNGGKLVVFPGDLAALDELGGVIRRHGVTTLWLTSGLFNAMVDGNLDGLRSLRRVLTGGDALSVPHVERALAALPGVTIINGYGPTEGTTFTTCHTVLAADTLGTISIGRPIANTTVYVLDAHRQLAPLGVLGELYVGGDGVARGYLDRAELTAERFTPDVFSGSGQLYRTGDVVRFLDGGLLAFVGRRDFQVKIRGFRIELGEIEAVLAQHPSARAVCVLAREDIPGDKRLVAYVAIGDAPAPSAAEFKAFLAARLPDHLVPSAFVTLAALPLNENGKVARKALPAPDASAISAREHVAPRGPIEQAIAAIFGDLLRHPDVSAHDGFFELGGHSLLATQAVGRIRAALGVALSLRALFEATTPAELARRVEAALAADRGAPPPPLVAIPREASLALALSFGEERLWFLDQLQPGDASYVVPWPIYLTGPLDGAALRRALSEVVRRHEILRTTYGVVGARPVVVIHPPSELVVEEASLTMLPAEQRVAAARAAIAAETARPFDLAAGPLFRARLLVLGDEDHVLLLAMHHIVTDGWSMGVLDREIATLYAAFSRGEPSPLADLAIQYADHAAWQRAWLSGDVLDAQLAYWKAHLAGAPRALDLPTDRPRPPVQTYRGARRGFVAPEALARAASELSRREGVTLFMTLLAAFEALLHRLTGQVDVVVGTPIASRTRPETEGLIGFFVNTVVLRVGVDAGASFRALLGRAREAALGAYAHQEMPFERLVQELSPERDPSRSPLFQVMFMLQNVPRAATALPGVKRRELGAPTVTAKFDLQLSAVEGPSGLSFSVDYNVDLFDAATIDRLGASYLTLLEGAVADPARLVGELPLLPESERRALLAWNDVTTSFPADTTLHELFERQVDRAPDAVAVTIGGESLTYRELDERANRLAQHLLARGVEREELIGLAVHRSLAMVVGILGILKAGGAYLPLDPEYPTERLAFMIEDSQIGILLTEAELSGALPAHRAQVICLDAEWPRIAGSSAERPRARTTPPGLAYVIYTSGSTGKPKGALVTHANVVRLFAATDAWYRFDATDVWTMFHSYAFDFSVWEIWGALLHGGRLVVVPYWISREPAAFYRLLGDEGVTVLNQTPSAFRQLVHVDESASISAVSALRLRLVIFGGEALDLGDLRGWWERHGDVTPRLVNMYGITETTVHVTYRPVSKADLARSWSSVIGRPIPDLQVYVLDPRRELAPIGVVGEMYVGGAGVARGYLRRPDLTAERFLPDPWSPGKTLYKTGDLARVLADGDIEYLGRIDHQVKIRGFRIELGEIEAVLDTHASVREAVVLAREDVPGDKRLAAYLVCTGEAPSVAELRDFVKAKLPEYMVPSAFVFLDALPLTENGKVDRRALPAPSASAGEARAHVAPRGPVEEALAAIFAEVLRVPVVSAHDGFFELGGHSLLATQVIGRVRDAFAIELPLRALFDATTPAELAARVDEALRAERGVLPPRIVPVPRAEATRLSFGQERLWFLDQLEPGDPSYILPEVLRLGGALDAGVLHRALSAIVLRHEVLRTTFTTVDGRPIPVIHDDAEMPFAVTVRRDLPIAERAAAVRREALIEARAPFDLRTGPVIRARLVELADDDHALLLTMHHIVSDGWSIGVLNREIMALYEAFLAGRPSPLPALAIQYGDYAHWQRSWFQGEALQHQLDHVKARLAGAPRAIELPTDRPRPPVQAHRGSTVAFALTSELGASLQELSRRHGATLFMTLLAAFDVLLHRITGQSDLVVGSPIAGRTRVETEGSIGFFLNTLVLRAELADDLSFGDLLARVKESCLDAYAHQDLPFERLVQEIAPERDLSRSPVFQVMFILQNTPAGGMAAPAGLTLRGAAVDGGTAKFDLTLGMIQRGDGGLAGSLEYDTALFDASTIERILGYFRILLEGIVHDPTMPLWQLPLLPAEERRHLVVDWNRTEADFPRDATVHALFAAQARRTPDAVAVACGGEQLSYRALDERANQLASYLKSRGVGPDVLVGICTGRSLALVVAILAVLKAGGAYVPMDPEYPRERLAFMLEDAGAPVLLTESKLVSLLPVGKAQIVAIDGDWAAIGGEPTAALEGGSGPEDLAYVIYTSGSTGKPKGAMLVHRGVVNYLTWAIQAYRVAEGEGAPLHSSIGFDLTVTSLFTPLLTGKCVRLVPEGQGIEALAGALRASENQSLVKITPAHLEVLSQQLAPAEAANRTRAFIIGGEALMGKSLTFFQENAPATRLINEYGPTETVVGCCVHEVAAGEANPGAVPIGRPIANTQLYVLDRHLTPVPTGVVGEIYIGGVQVGRGYLNRPDLTAERFLPDPFGPPGARLYRTGDLARHLPSGVLEYLGRIDHQVKIRGYRIELGEIEAALARHPAVREIAVLAREDVPGQKRLVAYLGCESGSSPTVVELRAFLKDTLPEYMIPAAFVVQGALPLTTNGKVDRAALPAPEQGGEAALGEDFVAARTAIEEELTRIWRAVLRRKQVGIHDNFFSSGGDSILSIQVVSRAQQAGLVITPRQMFQHQTIAELAEVAGQGRVVIDAEQGPVTGAAPLTPIQRWWASLAIEGAHHWNQAFLVEVSERLEIAALERAVDALIEHHDALRLRLHQGGTGLEQLFTPPGGPTPLRVVDLAGVPAADTSAAIEAACADAQASLDLDAGPVIRVAYLDLGPARAPRVFLAIHHLAVDGVSWRIFFEDLWSGYAQARAEGGAIVLPRKTTSFKRWAERLVEHAESGIAAAEIAFWIEQNRRGITRIPLDHETGRNDEASARSVTVSLDADETEHLLRDVPGVYRTQINDVLLSAFVEAFARWTGDAAALVDLEGHGREELFADVDLTRTVGWFTSIFPVVLARGDARGPGELLKSVKEQLRAIPERGVGYGLLRQLRRGDDVGAALAAMPQAEVIFNYLGQFDQPGSAEPAPPSAIVAGESVAKSSPTRVLARPAREPSGPALNPRATRTHLLEIIGSVTGGRLHVRFTYSEARHRAATIEAFAAGFIEALRGLIAHCLSPAAGGATPSDFQNASVTQDMIDMLAGFDPGLAGDGDGDDDGDDDHDLEQD
jgi:amino acid adenylation domain-containing protein/non-ribosomal peptide synthase protein (TIGR01720 family)